MTLLVLIVATSAALLVGVAWVLIIGMPPRLEGALIALAGGALLIAAVLELIQPVIHERSLLWPFVALSVGALLYTLLIQTLNRAGWIGMAEGSAGKILMSGVPQNLAIGLSLIGYSAVQISALVGSILASNVPWAANATRGMLDSGHSKLRVAATWAGVIAILAGAAFLGRYGFGQVPEAMLNYLRCFAAGAIICALAVDVFPQAFKTDERLTGLATIAGVILALTLNRIG
tara:strand:+ start:830 stop:1525 length:696 start_codon:yes stop_codon:yes gene_type:complete